MEEALQSLRQAEKATYLKLEEKMPDKLKRPVITSPQAQLTQVGIRNIAQNPAGFIRMFPEDFIVEEIGPDKTVTTIEPDTKTKIPAEPHTTLYADLVKIGIGTIEAINDLAKQLNSEPTSIGYAGLKDSRALTSQRISIRKVSNLPALPKSQYFIKNLAGGKGALAPGQLQGNRFTMTVRTKDPVDIATLETKAKDLAINGFPNFYGVQRFGNRLLNPLLGKLLCQGNPQEAIKVFLCNSGPADIPLFTLMRQKALNNWGNWAKMQTIFDILPYTFRHERKLLHSLINEPNNWTKALAAISDQTKFWMYGYVSFLVNELLSDALIGAQDIPDPLPLPLSDKSTDDIYAQYLERDGTTNYQQYLKQYRFFLQKYRTILPWISPTIHHIKQFEAGVVLSFSLPKAAYATTFLMFLFDTFEGTPVPEWVKIDQVDAKEFLGTGSVTQAKTRLDTSLITTILPEKNNP